MADNEHSAMASERFSEQWLEETASAYVLGSLESEEDRRAFESLLVQGDPEATQLLEQMMLSASALGRNVEEQEAPTRVRASLAARIQHQSPSRNVVEREKRQDVLFVDKPAVTQQKFKQRSITSFLLGALASAVVFMIGYGLVQSSNQSSVTAVKEERDSLRVVLRERMHDDSVTHAVFTMLQERNSYFVVMTKAPEAPRQHLFWSPRQRMVVVMRETLGPLDSNKVYQVWQFADSERPISLGTFAVDPQKPRDMFDFKSPMDTARAFEITVEPKGGSPEPRGPVLYAGLVQDRPH